MKIVRKINKYIPFFKAGTKQFLVYKAQSFMWLIICFVDIAFIFFLYEAIYKSNVDGINAVINGFKFKEIILYAITSFCFSFSLHDETSFNILSDVKEGTISSSLTKPVSYRLRHFFQASGNNLFQFVFIGFPLLIIIYLIYYLCGFIPFNINTFFINLLYFIIFYLISMVLNNSMNYLLGLLSFYSQHMFGLQLVMEALQMFFSGQSVPFAFMGLFGTILHFNPFAFLNSTPILVLMDKVDPLHSLLLIGVGIVWIVIFESINKLIFSSCMKKLVIQGG